MWLGVARFGLRSDRAASLFARNQVAASLVEESYSSVAQKRSIQGRRTFHGIALYL